MSGVTSISLGNFYQSGGKNLVGSAGGSGFDTKTIVDDLVQVRQDANVTPLQTQVTNNTNKSSALTQLQTLLSNFQSSLNSLRGVPGFDTASQNAFDYTNANESSNTSVPASNYMDVSAAAGASLQSYSIDKITQLATASKQSTGDFPIANSSQSVVAASSTPGQFTAGIVTIKGVPITLNAGDSLDNVAQDFNNFTSQTGIIANVLQVSSGHYQLIFSSTQTGTANAFDISNANTLSQVSDLSGVLTNVGIATTTGGDAQDAKFTINGIEVTRSTNSVSDVISGLTFNLKQATPNGTAINVSVTPDTATVQSNIVTFMNNYNALAEFVSNQSQLNSDGTLAATSYLATDTLTNNTLRQAENVLSSVPSGLGGNKYNSLASLGITFTDIPATTDSTGKVTQAATANVLTYDQSTLKDALASNFSQVKSLFEFTSTTSNPNLAVYTGPASLPANSITVTIDPTAPTPVFQASYTDASGHPQTINLTATASGSGYSLAAPANSDLAGLVLLYASSNAATIVVNATQGIADQLYQSTTATLQQNTGALAVEQSALQSSSQNLQNQITQQTSFIDAYRTQLQQKFAALETAISSANSILQTLYAQQVAQLGASA